ncbi:MAG: hypothetical protein J6M18_06790 [Actinomycetaceae bacterium]|nr:hypothetical protein [Actinomycetaceae bacterium]
MKASIHKRDDEKLIQYKNLPGAHFSVPTPEHYLPLLFVLGASRAENLKQFNDVCHKGSISMLSFVSDEEK